MAFEPTPVQRDAINAKGNVLVSAAAGSGKTAVLTERVVSLICDKEKGISADKILVVTFTKAAAAEMRSRIEARLNEECEKQPENVHLMRQMLLFPSAKICTIDSFCIELVRENFDKLNINPDFKVVDDSIMVGLRAKAISQVFDKQFSSGDTLFLKLLETVGSVFDDSVLVDFVQRIHTFTTTLPNPHEWLKNAVEANDLKSHSDFWLDYVYDFSLNKLNTAKAYIDTAVKLLEDYPEIYEKYKPAFNDSADKINKFTQDVLNRNWDALYYGVASFKLLSLPPIKGTNDISQIRAAKNLRENAKSICKALGNMFFDLWENIVASAQMLYPLTEKLVELVIDYDNELNTMLRERNVMTFYNTEQMAFNLLCSYENGKVEIREEARDYIDNFDEILVDEYQDTNALQDMLFKVLSDNERKLFVVGDVKQSIYRFRGAEPSNFLSKKNAYLPFSVAKENEPKKIILDNNFRSRSEICDYINFFFSNLMTAHTGAIEYGDEEKLCPLAKYPDYVMTPVEIGVITASDAELKNAENEADYIAYKIKEIMGSGQTIRDEKDNTKLRPAKYSDFAVLLRSAKNNAAIYASRLKSHGIPVSYSTASFINNREISIILSLIDILDNPTRDISLVTVMLSPLFSFTVDDLAVLRGEHKAGNMYSCVTAAAVRGDERYKAFLKTLDNFRRKLSAMSVDAFLFYIYEQTDFLNMMSAIDSGETRKNNLLLLCRYAKIYEENEGRSVGGFVRYMQQLDDEKISASSNNNKDAVTISTVHLSKGLQFPVCFFAACSDSFNKMDLRASLIIDREHFFSFRFYDADVNKKFTTLQRQVLVERSNQLMLEEELRLAYVAMTRAQDKLILLLSVNKAENKIETLAGALSCFDSGINEYLFRQATSFADWILMTSLIHPDGKNLRDKTNIQIICQNDSSHFCVDVLSTKDYTLTQYEQDTNNADASHYDSKQVDELKQKLKDKLDFVYPFEPLLSVESKSSVSKLANSAEDKKFIFNAQPSFAYSEGISAAKRGTATHKVMQFIDFERAKQDMTFELERLVEWQFISEEDAKATNTEQLKVFLSSELCERIMSSNLVKREMRFLTEKPATQIDNSLDVRFADEMIVVQGAVDCLFEEKGEIIVVDFKTDRVSSEHQLIDTYSEQLSIYAGACEKIFSMPVKEKIIYSFYLGKSIKL